MKKSNVYNIANNALNSKDFKISLIDQKALSIIDEIPDEKLDNFLSQSLSIGVTALYSAIQKAEEVKLSEISENMLKFFNEYKTDVTSEIGKIIETYFDPEKGVLEKRINNLIIGKEGDGGEIGRLIAKQLRGPESPLERGLKSFVGPESQLFKSLDPENSKGVVEMIRAKIEKTVQQQNVSIVEEFSLDKENSALNRFISELKKETKLSGQNFQDEVKNFKNLFSLDNDDGVFTKLEKKLIEQLADIKGEIIKLNTKKEVEKTTTIQGNEFEDKVYHFTQDKFSDMCEIEKVGNRTGIVQRSKVGDVLLTLNSDSRGAGRKIVIEVKSDESYNMNKARDELKIAKKNRGAEIGIFVFEKNRKPKDLLRNLHREGKDIFVCWDPEELYDEAFLEASIQLSVALITQEQIIETDQKETLDMISSAIISIEQSVDNIHKIESSTSTIERQVTDIRKFTQKAKKNLNDEIIKLSKIL